MAVKIISSQMRDDIVTHVVSLLYPTTGTVVLANQMKSFFLEYFKDNFGNGTLPDEIEHDNSAAYYIRTENDNVFFLFNGPYVTMPWIEEEFSTSESYNPHYTYKYAIRLYINLETCPISKLRYIANKFMKTNMEKIEFKTLLFSELMKAHNMEAFTKKFPEMKPLLTPFLEDEVSDLPEEILVDCDSIVI